MVTPGETADPVFAREQETENIDELPCERIKEPGALDRPGRQVHAEPESGGIDRERGEQQERRSIPVEKRDRRRNEKQNDIQGKNVEIAELMGEQNETDMRPDRIGEDGRRIVPVEEEGRIEKDRGRRKKRDGQLRND